MLAPGAELAARGQQVRLWVDDASALALDGARRAQGLPGVEVLPWTQPLAPDLLAGLPPGDVLVEAFGCEIAPEFMRLRRPARAQAATPVWINLEYLSRRSLMWSAATACPRRCMRGPAKG